MDGYSYGKAIDGAFRAMIVMGIIAAMIIAAGSFFLGWLVWG